MQGRILSIFTFLIHHLKYEHSLISDVFNVSTVLCYITRMHSSRMRTSRSLTVCWSLLLKGGGCLLWGGVCSQERGVCSRERGVCSRERGVCSRERGVCSQGGVCSLGVSALVGVSTAGGVSAPGWAVSARGCLLQGVSAPRGVYPSMH